MLDHFTTARQTTPIAATPHRDRPAMCGPSQRDERVAPDGKARHAPVFGHSVHRHLFHGQLRNVVLPLLMLWVLMGPLDRAAAQTTVGTTAELIAQKQFLQQLTERRLFAVARQHTRRLQQQAATSDTAVFWQLQQAAVYRQQAWYLDQPSRSELLRQSIEELSETLRERVPSVERNLQIRLEIAHTLIHSVLMAVPPAEGGHLFGQRQPVMVPTARDAHVAALRRAEQMAAAALTHLEQSRADMDADRALRLRDRGRVLHARVSSLTWRISDDETIRPDLAERAQQQWAEIQRTARADRQKTEAALQLAELAMFDDRRSGFDTRMKSAGTDGIKGPFGQPAFFEIRRHLRETNAEAALRTAKAADVVTDLQQQHLQWLILESLLGLTDAALQLSDHQLHRQVAQQFETQRTVVERICEGVFAEAARRTTDRFELLTQVGPEVADLMEQIDALETAGKRTAALQQIDVALQRLAPIDTETARGALNFKAGQLLLRQNSFADAQQRMTLAVKQFSTADLTEQAAAADLLRIFSLARQLDSGAKTVGLASYQEALETHLRLYGQQATADQAAAWLQKLLSRTNPLAAAQLALQRYERTPAPGSLTHLTRCGRLLVRLRFAPSGPAPAEKEPPSEHRSLQEQFLQHWTTQLDQLTELPQKLAGAAVCGLLLQLTAETSVPPWQEYRVLLQQLQPWAEELQKDSTDELAWTVSRLIVNARSDGGSAGNSDSVAALLQMQPPEQLLALTALGEQLQGTIRRGNSTLTAVAERLLSRYLEQDAANRSQPATLIPVTCRIAVFADRPALLQLVLAGFAKSATPQALQEVLQALHAQTELVAQRASVVRVTLQFLQQVLSDLPQGSASWLEASLHRSALLHAIGRHAEAARQLQLVQTLYPDWGDVQRQQTAQQLLRDSRAAAADSEVRP